MAIELKNDQWVYTIIQEPEKNPQYLGQRDEDKDIEYVPLFLEKEHALQCVNLFKKDKLLKYETQAVIYEELAKDARKNGFLLVVLDGEGKVVEWVTP